MQHPLLIELEALGCNVKDGLYNCMDMEDFYIKMVKKAVAHDSLAPLIDACGAEDVKACFERSHALKGVYANLGLKPLFDLNTPIVETTRHGGFDGVPEALEKLISEHKHFEEVAKKYPE
ncbi:MAG TPA: hypothetical protein PLU75_08505 [Oscillospiraceae bacterium]|nr:hypothetical protein [Oscillospiraceae bacterium]HRW56234.1 hypothetical protein [Oscillospiraceae bacterium]